MVVVTLELAVQVDSLAWVPKAVLAEFVTCVLFVTTNTKEALVLDVALKCNVLTSKNVSR